eukprot:CAMPEP_0118961202 /NCGR_PEP_ID=MMETSP1169-20130426/64022_1 /TAXON_ID=36882 /ORGANISM="Pyramimonas obovata, Strain CCMP722" /LENGTH=253 /DNA_ID=CAMNT_0006909355 /DNA_START=669 /DNA_END=1430 /DNA_ORIENTATION=-
MIGDSHIRNLFEALVASVRQEEFFAMPHGFQSVYHYSVGPDGDFWHMVSREHFDGVTLKSHAHEFDDLHREGPAFVSCTARGLGEPCVDIVYAWAPIYPEQFELTGPLMRDIKPQFVIASINSWEKTVALDPKWTDMWEGVFPGNPQLEAFMFVMWPHGLNIAQERQGKVTAWMEALGARPFRRSFLNMLDIHKHIKSDQLDKTWHDVCGVYNNWPQEAFKINAHEACTGNIPRALMRVALTMGLPPLIVGEK